MPPRAARLSQLGTPCRELRRPLRHVRPDLLLVRTIGVHASKPGQGDTRWQDDSGSFRSAANTIAGSPTRRLEDYALRFTAKSARRWTTPRVAQTAIGAISFLALEAIGGAITLSHGYDQRPRRDARRRRRRCLLTGLPIACYAARYGVDIDLLTRGAGFGYIGSTITSLIYATFTFILLRHRSLDHDDGARARLRHSALARLHPVGRLAVIPLVTHGITWISRFQLVDAAAVDRPQHPAGRLHPVAGLGLGPSPVARLRGARDGGSGHGLQHRRRSAPPARSSLGLMPQIGEQVDILRFLPSSGPRRQARPHRDAARRRRAGSSSGRRSSCSARSSRCWRCATACRPSTRPSRRRCMSSPSAMCCPGRMRCCSSPPPSSWCRSSRST